MSTNYPKNYQGTVQQLMFDIMNMKQKLLKLEQTSGKTKTEIKLLEEELMKFLLEHNLLERYLDSTDIDTQGLNSTEIEQLFLDGVKYDNDTCAMFKDAKSAAKMLGLPIN